MKRLITIIFALIGFYSFGQVTYVGSATTAQIDGLTIPSGRSALIYNSTLSQYGFENSASTWFRLITSQDIDTYAEFNAIVGDVTITHNGLIDTYSELNTIVADVTLTHNGLIDTFAELDAIVADQTLATTSSTQTLTNKTIDGDSNTILDVSASEVNITDAGALITATDVEGALAENRAAIDLNTAKVTNATHTGEVTGATALTIASGVVDSDNIVNGTIDETDLDTSVNASLDLADSAVQEGDSPTFDAVTSTNGFYRVGSSASYTDYTISRSTIDNALKIGAETTISSNSFQDYLSFNSTGLDITGDITATGDLAVNGQNITSTGDLILQVDSDNNTTNNFQVTNGAAAVQFQVSEFGDATVGRDLYIDGNDIWALGDLELNLDYDNNGTNSLIVNDGAGTPVFAVNESGNITTVGTIVYDNTISGLVATDIKGAIDEIAADLGTAVNISDTAYGAGWNGDTTNGASKNAIYDKLENMVDSDVTGEPTGADQVLNMVSLTQAEYNAGTPVSGTYYVITDAKVSDVIQIACSDLTTAVTTGTSKAYFRMPWAATLTGVRVSLLTAGTTTGLTVDINEGDTPVSVLSTKLTTDAAENTSTTAATAAVISDNSLADDALITIDFDAVPTGGAGVIVTLYVDHD